jgi:hypothetical protein
VATLFNGAHPAIATKLTATRRDGKLKMSRLARGTTSAKRLAAIFENFSQLRGVIGKFSSMPVHFLGSLMQQNRTTGEGHSE